MNEQQFQMIVDYLDAMNNVMVTTQTYVMLLFFIVGITCGMLIGRMIAKK